MAINNELIQEEIRKRIQKTGRYPFLFIGAGISQRYMDAERWEGLLRYFCKQLSGNEFQYDYYANQISDKDYYGLQPRIASMLEKDYNNAVLSQDQYLVFRTQHKEQIQQGISAFKIAIADYCKKQKINTRYTDELNLLKKAAKRNISGIITTNYDNLLERIFSDYAVYNGQNELIFSDIYELSEIYKIHGSENCPESIIITAEDYAKLEATQPYLIAKILTIFLEYPIIFLGYSISDKDIQNILSDISICLDQKHLSEFKERFIFVEYENGDSVETMSNTFEEGKRIEMTRIKTKDFGPIYQAFCEVQSTYSPKVLRKLRKEIYELVSTTNPSSSVEVTDFEGIEKIDDNTRLIIGIGTSSHYIKAEQIYEDVVLNNKHFNPELVVEEYLPELLKSNSGGLPLHKYLLHYEKELFERVKDCYEKYNSADSFLNKQLRHDKENYRRQHSPLTVNDVIAQSDKNTVNKKLCFLEQDQYDCSKLENYLQNLLKNEGIEILKGNSDLKRLIRIYDWLKYSKKCNSIH